MISQGRSCSKRGGEFRPFRRALIMKAAPFGNAQLLVASEDTPFVVWLDDVEFLPQDDEPKK